MGEAVAKGGHRILHARRDLLMVNPIDDFIGLNLAELLNQNLLADADDQAPKFAKTARPTA